MRESKKKIIFALIMALFMVNIAYAARIEGIVVDGQNGDPLPGVSVLVRGSKAGMMTDVNGKFTIEAAKGSILTFSYIGYRAKEYRVGASATVKIAMESESFEMNEVVVVGVGMKKSDLTGSVSRVTADDIANVPTSDFNTALQGKIPGVFIQANAKPGDAASIKIRGNNSIQYGTNPIYVVDGLVIDSGFEMINPSDIATVDILKDASATAIYGARGANGVVVITTKKGKKGHGKVTYEGWVGGQSFSKTMKTINGSQLRDLRIEAYTNEFNNITKLPAARRTKYINDNFLSTTVPPNTIFTKDEMASYLNGDSYDWLDEVTRNAYQQNHAVSFSGGSDTGSYLVSFSYNQQTGLMKNVSSQRYSGKVNLEEMVKPWLKIGTNNTFVYKTGHPVATDNTFITALKADPLLPISGDYWYMNYGTEESQSESNPIRDLNIIKDSNQTRFMSSNYVDINPIKGLDIRSTFSVDYWAHENYTYYSTETTQSYKNSAKGEAVQGKSRNLNWQWDNTVAYNTLIADKHKVSGILGMNMSYYGNNSNSMDGRGFGNDFFDYKYMAGAADKEDASLSSDFSTYSMAAVFLRASYSYDSRYYLTMTGRYDGSSKFGSNNKWGFFPSVSGSWNITGEQFMKNQHIIDNLRLRLGYGIAGNQNIPNYGYLTRYGTRATLGTSALINWGQIGNPNLKWEKQKQFNAGIDVAILKNRLSFTFDYFHIMNKDLLMTISKSPSSGYLTQLSNVGTLRNQGVELGVTATPVSTKDWTWNIGFNISADRNKIIKLDGEANEIYSLGGYSNNEIQTEGNLFVGQSLNTLYMYKFGRIVQESDMDYVNTLQLSSRIVQPGDVLPLDADGNKIINDKDRQIVGNKDPKFYGGVNTSVTWRGLELSAICNYSQGAKKISYLYNTLIGSDGRSAAHIDVLDRWTPDHTNTTIPRAYHGARGFGYGSTDLCVQNASFFRLSSVTLAYTLPKRWTSVVFLDNVRVYFTGSNLFTITKYKGFDPETGDWYPNTKMYVGGINVSF